MLLSCAVEQMSIHISVLSSLFRPRINFQALELGEEVRKKQDEEKTEENYWEYPAACSEGTG